MILSSLETISRLLNIKDVWSCHFVTIEEEIFEKRKVLLWQRVLKGILENSKRIIQSKCSTIVTAKLRPRRDLHSEPDSLKG
jgi:hypothetical protein